ncbi:MAG: hypothetical protein OEY64_05810 [Nitrospinota bacterium]|nr:hypothetical protein [Nitrospinota bacterium]
MSPHSAQEKDTQEVVKTRVWKIWSDDYGIVWSQFLPGEEQTLDDAKEFIDALKKFAPGGNSVGLIDIRNVKKTNHEVRAYFAKEGKYIGLACAILVGSPMSSAIGNFFLKINKPDFSARLFHTEASAMKWLKGFMK